MLTAGYPQEVDAGGKMVTPRTAIPGMGAYGRVSDTEGNILGLFEPAM